MNRRRLIADLLFFLYLAALLRITVFRSGCFSNGLLSGRVEWVPFLYLARLVRVGNWRYFTYLFVGNLIWFVPLGLWLHRRGARLWQTALAAMLLSLLIECGQYLLGSGVSEVEDIILNTAGGVLGDLAGRMFLKRKTARSS